MKRKEMERILKQNGFINIRTNKHLIFSDGSKKSVAIPSRMDYSKGLCRRILQQAGFDKEKIWEILK